MASNMSNSSTYKLLCDINIVLHVTLATLLFAIQYFGDPIDCLVKGNDHGQEMRQDAIDSYCWSAKLWTFVEGRSGGEGKMYEKHLYM